MLSAHSRWLRLQSVLAGLILVVVLPACGGSEESTGPTGSPSASAAPTTVAASATPGPSATQAPYVSYNPQSGPVGTRVTVGGNVGQAILAVYPDPHSPGRRVRVDMWKFDAPGGKDFALTIGNLPVDVTGDFHGDVTIPAELEPHQQPADTPNFRVVPGRYELHFHLVDVDLFPFTVTE